MKNPFKQAGFDTLIATGTAVHGDLVLNLGSTTVIDGSVTGRTIMVNETDHSKASTTLIIGGDVQLTEGLTVTDVTVTGTLNCDTLRVDGTLAIKLGAKVTANLVQYRRLIIEPGAKLNARLQHLSDDSTALENKA